MPTAFPEGFLWGAATAPHQVEGGNVNSDMWEMEWATPSVFAEPSGRRFDAELPVRSCHDPDIDVLRVDATDALYLAGLDGTQ